MPRVDDVLLRLGRLLGRLDGMDAGDDVAAAGALAELRRRSSDLNLSAEREAVEVNEAILRLAGIDVIATRRLAGVLIKLGELDRADEVLQEALERSPDDVFLRKREQDLASARRRVEERAASGAAADRRSAPTAPRRWIKALHYTDDGWTVEPGAETWISDPGQRDSSGARKYTVAGDPWGRPSWQVGDRVGLYFAGTGRVPVLVEVITSPAFDPELVQRDGREPDSGERWPWVTWVRGLLAKRVDMAPSLSQLGIRHESMQQRARLLIDEDIYERLRKALD